MLYWDILSIPCSSIWQYILHFFSCTGPDDDPFRPCFACEGFAARKVYGSDYDYGVENNFISRQTGESFQSTRRSRRVVRGRNGRARLRVDRAMQMRARTYARTQSFVQSEQYLSDEDVDIIRYRIK